MMELVMQVTDAGDEQSIREAVGNRPGVEVISSNEPSLDERPDVDALAMEDWPAVDIYCGQPPRVLGWVVLDSADDARLRVYEAAVAPIRHEYAVRNTLATWVVSYPHIAPAGLPDVGIHGVVSSSKQAPRPLANEEIPYFKLLNALEMMERHNRTGTEPPIRRVGVQAWSDWALGLLRAYDTYRDRAQAGAYR